MRGKRSWVVSLLFLNVVSVTSLRAQPPLGSPPGPPGPAKTIAPIDITGQWVSIVTEDWRWRMMTPPKGDYSGVALNPDGRKVADAWDAVKDEAAGNQCKSYGAAAIMRMPTRVRLSWTDDETMKLETDAGMQTRMFYFREPKSKGNDWQGVSNASWELVGGGRSGPVVGGSLRVITTKMAAGYLRKNGVPYSDQATVTEYYDLLTEPNGDKWLMVKTIVEDPVYLLAPFIISSHFRKQNDTAGWDPTSCSAQ